MVEIEKLQNISILYVEDDESIREELVDILEMDVGKLYVASDGIEGLELFKKHRPDIILTDIQMPRMDGLEMSELIREFDYDVPIIITTAFNDPSFLIRAIDIGVDKYVTKPIDLHKLEETIYRSAKTIFQQRVIDEQIELSQISMNRSYDMIFVTGKDFSFMNKSFLNYLGYKTLQEFEQSGICICEHILDETKELTCQTKDDWIRFMEKNPTLEHIVYLAKCEDDKKIVAPYKVEHKYFSELEQHMLMLSKIDK
jgi:YesN/AraC family two-component response regulator